MALTAGIDLADGDAVIVMDADGQDPPEVIPELVARWLDGYDVVFGTRVNRKGPRRGPRRARGLRPRSPAHPVARQAGCLTQRSSEARNSGSLGRGPRRGTA